MQPKWPQELSKFDQREWEPRNISRTRCRKWNCERGLPGAEGLKTQAEGTRPGLAIGSRGRFPCMSLELRALLPDQGRSYGFWRVLAPVPAEEGAALQGILVQSEA